MSPVGGLNLTEPPSDLALGQTPSSENWIVRNGFLEKRATIQSRATQGFSQTIPVLGGAEITDTIGNNYPFASYTTRQAWYSVGSWSLTSYVSSYGVSDPPSNSTVQYWDATQIYYDQRDENVAVMATETYQQLYVWQSNTTVFSTLTGAPQAKYVAAFDSFLLAFNIRQSSLDLVQRVQWTDRGSISSWTGGLSGFQDMIDMKGQGTRLIPHDNVVIAASDQEIWAGRRIDLPFVFDFQPLDRGIGMPFPWAVTQTRIGLVWLGKDYNVYLLASGSAKPVAVGDAIQPEIQALIDQPQRSTMAYNRITDQVEMWIPVRGGNGRPQRGYYGNLKTGTWLPQTIDPTLDVTRNWQGTLGTGSASTTWSGISATGLTWNTVAGRWADQFGTGGQGDLVMYAGNSSGSLVFFNPTGTKDYDFTVSSRWRTGGLGGEDPTKTKTMREVRVDYVADSASSLTMRVSRDQGVTFEAGQSVPLPPASIESQVAAYVYTNARYPVVELVSEIGRPKIARIYAEFRVSGR